MALFQSLNNNDIRVKISYMTKTFDCMVCPFANITKNKLVIDQFINSETLINLLQPLLQLSWVKFFNKFVNYVLLRIVITMVYMLLIADWDPDPQIRQKEAEGFVYLLFVISILEIIAIFTCSVFIQKQFIAFIEKLNQDEMRHIGLELYFPDSPGGCCGKRIDILGIKRVEFQDLVVLPENHDRNQIKEEQTIRSQNLST